MLSNLKKELDKYSEEKELSRIKYTCCYDIQIEVFDFDKITERICTNLGISLLRSVDALYLSCKNNTLFLMEMKRYSDTISLKDFIIKHFFTDICEEGITIRKNNGECTSKIIDSIYILLYIIGNSNLGEDFYKYFMNPTKLKIAPLLVINLEDEDYVSMAMASLDKVDISITKRIEGYVEIINCSNLHKLLN